MVYPRAPGLDIISFVSSMCEEHEMKGGPSLLCVAVGRSPL